MIVTIHRKHNSIACTTGYLSVNNEIICYTLEKAALGNITNISSIPAGEYHAHIRTDGELKWRLELEEVPGRENVQIHIGNYLVNTSGCILVGTAVDLDACTVSNSVDALQKLRTILEGEFDITVEVSDTE